MGKYTDLNHMKLLKPNEIFFQTNYFPPHHNVVNEHSTTTKVKVIFDTAYKSTNQKSPNDILLKVPKHQRSIFDILL